MPAARLTFVLLSLAAGLAGSAAIAQAPPTDSPDNTTQSTEPTGAGSQSAPARTDGGAPPADASELAQLDEQDALSAVESGQALPFDQIAPQVRTSTGGEIIDARLASSGGRLIYEVKVLAPDGTVSVLHFDAQTGAPIGGN